MKHDFRVICNTCKELFLSHTFHPKKWWYFTAALHWMNNPSHQVLWFEKINNDLDIVFLSQQWRRVGILNLLQEIRDLKERFRLADLNEKLEKQGGTVNG